MEIQHAIFVKSSPDLKSCPLAGLPEYAFAGRSNVGKSTLLNLLINIKKMAKTSSTPGKTRLINHFLVNDGWYLVDLPGYGYARAGKKTRDSFLSTIGDYLLHRETLACLFILIDCRHRPLDTDQEFINWAGTNHIPIALVFTKTDKLSGAALARNTELYRNTLLQNWEELPVIFTSSSYQMTGRENILGFIEKSNKAFHEGKSMLNC
jgi:GTP-binding protein